MDKLNLNHRVCFKQIDEEQINRFLFKQKDELLLPDMDAVQQISDLLFEKGGVIGGFDRNGQMQAMIGFLFGDPSEAFVNKNLLFFYVLAFDKTYRRTRAFYKGLLAVFHKCQAMGVDRYRMQAGLTNRYINRLYSKIGTPIGESKTLRGQPVMTYEGSLKTTLSRFQ